MMTVASIKKAIRSADLEGVKLVPTRVKDLVLLLNYIELVERDHRSLEKALKKADDHLNAITVEALKVPKSLDKYA